MRISIPARHSPSYDATFSVIFPLPSFLSYRHSPAQSTTIHEPFFKFKYCHKAYSHTWRRYVSTSSHKPMFVCMCVHTLILVAVGPRLRTLALSFAVDHLAIVLAPGPKRLVSLICEFYDLSCGDACDECGGGGGVSWVCETVVNYLFAARHLATT